MNADTRVIVVLNMLGLDGKSERTIEKHMKHIDALDTLMTGAPGRARNAGFTPELSLQNPNFAKVGTILAERIISLELETPRDAARIGIAYACAPSAGMQYADREDSDIADATRAAFGRDPSLDEFNEALGAVGVGLAAEALSADEQSLRTLATQVLDALGVDESQGYPSIDALREIAA